MSERKTLSLGSLAEAPRDRSADPTKSWRISPARAEKLKERARDQRRNPSEAQALLWEHLKDRKCGGFTFNREVVMGSAIVDFACKPRWLALEIGGDGESDATINALSDRKLTDVGVRVLRFSDAQVLEDSGGVVQAIETELRKPFEKPRIASRLRSSLSSEGNA